jgi:dTDP-4-dehydrorhamnose 3,5-epimerase
MAYTVSATTLPGVLILEPQVFEDSRGAFFESFSDHAFAAATGLTRRFVQDGHSVSGPGVLRGLHYQLARPQGKLVRVIRGSIFDVAVDLRRSSPTFRQWVGVELSATNRKQVWVPEGFGHGFVVTSDGAEVHYKTTEVWSPAHDRGVRWDDPTLAVAWPISAAPVLSAKDAAAPTLADAELYD